MFDSLFGLSGKVAVVTGGTGVLGSEICRGLAQAGASLAILATTESRTTALAEELSAAGGQAIGIGADVLDKDSLKSAYDRVLDHYGKVDILINGAGGNRPQATASPDRSFFDLPADAVQWVFNLNFIGSLLSSQVFGRALVDQGTGVVLNISSMTAFTPLTRVVAYSGAKAAINNFTQWLAVHFAQEFSPAIRVNAIAPGFFMGEQNRYLLVDEASGELTPRGQQIINHTPMGRFGDPDDLIGTVLWLLSDASRFVTGIVVPVDGGFSAFGGV